MNLHVASFSSLLSGSAQAGQRIPSPPENSTRKRRLLRAVGTGRLSWGIVLVAVGCGGGEGHVKVAPVTGVVKYNGVPVRDAYVKFSQKGCPIIAGGFTD